MIAVWGFFLFALYPGLVPEDSYIQWQQVLTGNYADHHPILYALFMAIVSRFYPFPASVVMAQILMVSIAIAWGLDEMEGMGVPGKVLWAVAVLFGLLPINILSTSALFKDVPYSVAILILSIILLKIVNSHGKWIQTGWHWLGLGATLGAITLIRINGLPIAIGSVLLLLILYRFSWRRLVAAGGIFTFLLVFMYGPVYAWLKVKHEPEFGTILFLHHIAAHLGAGTPLSIEQETFLNKLAPIQDLWNYDCCQANPTMIAVFPGVFQQNYDLPILREDINRPARIALDLFLKDPTVDLRHMVCASQIIWSLNSSCPDRTPIDTYLLEVGKNTPAIFPLIITTEIDNLSRQYLLQTSKGSPHNPNLIMAAYLYLALYCVILFSIRQKNLRIFAFISPIALQSLTLLVLIISQAHRYQYGIALVGVLSICLLFVPIRPRLEK